MPVPESVLQGFRPFITDYPQRILLPPFFPQPEEGRGPSPVIGEIRGPATFPRERTNRETTENVQVSTLIRPGDPGAEGRLACLAPFGVTINHTEIIPAATVEFDNTAEIPQPFRLTHVSLIVDQAFINQVDIRILVGPSPSDGTNVPPGALEVVGGFGGSTGMLGTTVPLDIYPNYIVREPNWRIITRYNNTSVGARLVQLLYDVEFLS